MRGTRDVVREDCLQVVERLAELAGHVVLVLVSNTAKDVAGSGIEFEHFGARALKGVPGEWTLYVVRA